MSSLVQGSLPLCLYGLGAHLFPKIRADCPRPHRARTGSQQKETHTVSPQPLTSKHSAVLHLNSLSFSLSLTHTHTPPPWPESPGIIRAMTQNLSSQKHRNILCSLPSATMNATQVPDRTPPPPVNSSVSDMHLDNSRDHVTLLRMLSPLSQTRTTSEMLSEPVRKPPCSSG